jgi:hypothetical protein
MYYAKTCVITTFLAWYKQREFKIEMNLGKMSSNVPKYHH